MLLTVTTLLKSMLVSAPLATVKDDSSVVISEGFALSTGVIPTILRGKVPV